MKPKELDRILSRVAKQNNMTVQQVRSEIRIAMDQARKSTDPKAQAMWNSIPSKGDSPTLEEFMEYLLRRLANS